MLSIEAAATYWSLYLRGSPLKGPRNTWIIVCRCKVNNISTFGRLGAQEVKIEWNEIVGTGKDEDRRMGGQQFKQNEREEKDYTANDLVDARGNMLFI